MSINSLSISIFTNLITTFPDFALKFIYINILYIIMLF